MTKQEINKMFYDNCKEYNLYSLQLRYDKNTKNYVLDEKSHKEDEMIFKQSGLDNLVSQLLTLIENEKREEVKRFIRYEKANHFTGLLEFLDSDLEKFLEERK